MVVGVEETWSRVQRPVARGQMWMGVGEITKILAKSAFLCYIVWAKSIPSSFQSLGHSIFPHKILFFSGRSSWEQRA